MQAPLRAAGPRVRSAVVSAADTGSAGGGGSGTKENCQFALPSI